MRRPKGMVQVDAYLINEEDAARYIQEREACAEAAMDVMRAFCPIVRRDWAGSEDGEAVLGLDERGELVCLIHLDPQGVQEMREAMSQNRLKEFLLFYNGLADA